MKKFLKILLVILVTILGLLSILFTVQFSKSTVNVNLGTVFVAAVFIVYGIIASYIGSVLALITTFIAYPRKVVWFLSISYIVYFLLILNNLIYFLRGGPRAVLLYVPLLIYILAALRLFRKLAKGRA